MVNVRFAHAGIIGALALVALSSDARAQQAEIKDAYTCKATETQAECHKRLKCKADEEVEACQKRLRAAAAANKDPNNNRTDDRRDDDRGRDDNGRDDRRDDRGRDDDRRRDDDRDDNRSDRGRDRGRDDDDRGDRGDRGRQRGRRGRRGGGGGGGHGFEANKTFGAGLELGAPSGLNGKYFVRPTGALDFGIGVIYRHYYYDDGVHLYLDYLWHPVSLASTQSLEIPFYVGIGARFWNFDYCDRNDICDYGSAFGFRVPIGIALDFNNAPLDIFFQVVPTLDFLSGDYYNRYRDRNHFGFDGSIGIRFWFK